MWLYLEHNITDIDNVIAYFRVKLTVCLCVCVDAKSEHMFYANWGIRLTHHPLWPLLLTWFNFNPSMDK